MEYYSNRKKKMHYVVSGQSTPAGVCFTCGDIAAFAERKEDGTLHVTSGAAKKVNADFKKADKRFQSTSYPLLFLPIFLALAVISVWFAATHGANGWQIAGLVIFWIPSWWFLTCICNFFTPTYKKQQDDLQFKRHHGAEHKVYNAYHKTLDAPRIEEAGSYSRLCPACGCAYSGAKLFFAALVGLLIAFAPQLGFWKIILILLPVALFLFLALGACLPFHHPFELFELPTTSEPETAELEIACAAMQKLIELCEKNTMQNEKAPEQSSDASDTSAESSI